MPCLHSLWPDGPRDWRLGIWGQMASLLAPLWQLVCAKAPVGTFSPSKQGGWALALYLGVGPQYYSSSGCGYWG